MSNSQAHILERLHQEILPLQGFRAPAATTDHPDPLSGLGLNEVFRAFPGKRFPTGAIHEFCCADQEEAAASNAFISGILGPLLGKDGAALWIGKSLPVYPPALKQFGIDPHRVIFMNLNRQKDLLWATEEGLKCAGLKAVISEVKDLSFMVSRRLQLAVEQSSVTGFLLRNDRCNNARAGNTRHHSQQGGEQQPSVLNTTASIARWRIRPIPSVQVDDLPGVGYPRWNVSLLKVRNARPASWEISWAAGRFNVDQPSGIHAIDHMPKTGTHG